MSGSAYEALREVKRTFDPEGIFNPGKIIDSPPLTANLRFGAGYRTADPVTWFDYSAHGGMGRAVEMCSGVGACRKKLDEPCARRTARLSTKNTRRAEGRTRCASR